jgi:plastocyanin
MPSFARRLSAVIGAAALFAAGGLTLALVAPVAAASHTVQITDSAFGTSVLTVQVGDTVTWTNADDRPHTVTGQDGSFDSGNLDEGGTFSFTFTAPGTFAYLCQYHPEMTATIIVEAAAAPASANPQPAASPATAGGAASAGGDATGGQPDTAIAAPAGQIPTVSYLLWGAGLLLLGIRFLPMWARRVVPAARPPGGWRR